MNEKACGPDTRATRSYALTRTYDCTRAHKSLGGSHKSLGGSHKSLVDAYIACQETMLPGVRGIHNGL